MAHWRLVQTCSRLGCGVDGSLPSSCHPATQAKAASGRNEHPWPGWREVGTSVRVSASLSLQPGFSELWSKEAGGGSSSPRLGARSLEPAEKPRGLPSIRAMMGAYDSCFPGVQGEAGRLPKRKGRREHQVATWVWRPKDEALLPVAFLESLPLVLRATRSLASWLLGVEGHGSSGYQSSRRQPSGWWRCQARPQMGGVCWNGAEDRSLTSRVLHDPSREWTGRMSGSKAGKRIRGLSLPMVLKSITYYYYHPCSLSWDKALHLPYLLQQRAQSTFSKCSLFKTLN